MPTQLRIYVQIIKIKIVFRDGIRSSEGGQSPLNFFEGGGSNLNFTEGEVGLLFKNMSFLIIISFLDIIKEKPDFGTLINRSR